MTYKLEKGVALPRMRGFAPKPIAYPFAQMQMGDSFVVPVKPGEDAAKVRTAVTKVAQRFRDTQQADFAVVARVVPEGVRVWRVKYFPRPERRVRVPQVSYTHLLRDDDKPARVNGKARTA